MSKTPKFFSELKELEPTDKGVLLTFMTARTDSDLADVAKYYGVSVADIRNMGGNVWHVAVRS